MSCYHNSEIKKEKRILENNYLQPVGVHLLVIRVEGDVPLAIFYAVGTGLKRPQLGPPQPAGVYVDPVPTSCHGDVDRLSHVAARLRKAESENGGTAQAPFPAGHLTLSLS